MIPDEAEILEANVDAKLLGGKCEGAVQKEVGPKNKAEGYFLD